MHYNWSFYLAEGKKYSDWTEYLSKISPETSNTGKATEKEFSRKVVSDSATPWTTRRQASLSCTISQSLLKLMSIASKMPSNHLIFCHHLLLPPSIFPSIRVFSNELALHIMWPNCGRKGKRWEQNLLPWWDQGQLIKGWTENRSKDGVWQGGGSEAGIAGIQPLTPDEKVSKDMVENTAPFSSEKRVDANDSGTTKSFILRSNTLYL